MLGRSITQLAAYANGGYYLCGLATTFDNGVVVKAGTTGSNPVSTIDLTNDSVALMYVLLEKNDNHGGDHFGCKAIYIETTRGLKWSSYSSWSPATLASHDWKLVSSANGVCQNIVLVGIDVSSGSGIDNLSFHYKQDELMTRVVDEFEYTGWQYTPGTPINVASASVSNQTGETQTMSLSFETSVASSYNWSVQAGVKVGVSTEFKTGIPFIAEGKVQVSAELSFSSTYGQEHTVSEAFSYSANVSVPAGQTIKADATAASYSITGSYTASYRENWAHAGVVSKQVQGNIKGLAAYNVVVNYTSIA